MEKLENFVLSNSLFDITSFYSLDKNMAAVCSFHFKMSLNVKLP